jgi:uncharacterized protein YbjT (DUF2867 family)
MKTQVSFFNPKASSIMKKRTLIIGKTSKTGSRVNTLLQQAGHETRVVSRSTSPAFDWLNPEGWLEVMTGCDAAYVTYQPDLAVPAAMDDIAKFIRVAKQAGIKHLVLLSGRGEQGAQNAERLLVDSGLTWNVVRASWFAQNFSEGFLIDGLFSGTVALPAGHIPEPFIDVDDIAEVAAACLTQSSLHNQVFEVTGPELLTFEECVAILSEVIGRPIAFAPITAQQLLDGLAQQGLPDDVLWLMNELFTVVMDGRNSRVMNGVEQALGRKATSFREYAIKTAATGVWNVPSSSALAEQ